MFYIADCKMFRSIPVRTIFPQNKTPFVKIIAGIYDVFIMSYTETEAETDKKMGCIGLCGGVHTAQRQMTTLISIGFCVHVLGICPVFWCRFLAV